MALPLANAITRSVLAFRGYNITNLGKTPGLLAIPAYASIVIEELERFAAVCAETIGRPIDLVRSVRENIEPDLDHYAEAVALIVAIESAQLRLLREVHQIDYASAQFAFGYSLGELSALCAATDFVTDELIRVPLAMAQDCAELAQNVKMGILFSRGAALPEKEVWRLCQQITAAGDGVLGISAILSPNTILLVGQGDTVERFQKACEATPLRSAYLRMNPHRWPPLHTPIVRQRHVPDRAAVLLQNVAGGLTVPRPRLFSLVTGKFAYDDHLARETLRSWVDSPQRLWDAVCATLKEDVQTVIHIGPEPNVIPATFERVGENVTQQTARRSLESYGLRAVSEMARRPWLASLLPSRASLLKAPFLRQIILEDWLLENAPRPGSTRSDSICSSASLP